MAFWKFEYLFIVAIGVKNVALSVAVELRKEEERVGPVERGVECSRPGVHGVVGVGKLLESYSLHFIFFITYEWAQ